MRSCRERDRADSGCIFFPATKLAIRFWVHVPEARRKAEEGDLLFGTVDTWLLWNLTQGKVFATDYTNASRTMLFNIHTLEWDPEILAHLHIPQQMLPRVEDSSAIYGVSDAQVLGAEIPIGALVGDQRSKDPCSDNVAFVQEWLRIRMDRLFPVNAYGRKADPVSESALDNDCSDPKWQDQLCPRRQCFCRGLSGTVDAG